MQANASLAKVLLEDNTCPKHNKVFMGMKEQHNEEVNNPSFLTKKIESLLKT